VNEDEKYNTVKGQFKKKFYNEHEIAIEQHQGKARSLNQKISKNEVTRNAMKLSNNNAAGKMV